MSEFYIFLCSIQCFIIIIRGIIIIIMQYSSNNQPRKLGIQIHSGKSAGQTTKPKSLDQRWISNVTNRVQDLRPRLYTQTCRSLGHALTTETREAVWSKELTVSNSFCPWLAFPHQAEKILKNKNVESRILFLNAALIIFTI